MRRLFLALAVLLLPGFAQAQEASIDPRLATPLVLAMKAELALRDAALKAQAEDAQKREAEWAEYSKPLWSTAPEGK